MAEKFKMLLDAVPHLRKLQLVAQMAVTLDELGLLTDEERQRVRAEIARYHQRQGAESDESEFAA